MRMGLWSDALEGWMYSRILGPCLEDGKSGTSGVYGWVADKIRFKRRRGAVQEDAVEPRVFVQIWLSLKSCADLARARDPQAK